MPDSSLDRREFHRLTAAALGGIAAGSVLGCGGGNSTPEAVRAASEVHLCRGLNECKGRGKGGDNACRGQGACATAKEHGCGGQNDCKWLGGCGTSVGANECKGKGGCHVPLMEDAWKTLREKREAEWKEKGLEMGAAPEAAKGS